jgi:DNA polymerase-3 subunit delta
VSDSALISALEGGARAVYAQGDTPLLVARAVAAAEAWGLARCGLPAFNHTRACAGDERARDAVHAARTVPMMSGLRVVTLLDIEQGAEPLMEDLLGYLEDPSPATLLIVAGGAFGKPRKGEKAWGQRLANAFKKAGYVERCDSAGVDRVRFAIAHAADLGARLAAREAGLLVELVGQDLGRIACEVEKLAVYAGGRDITADDLRDACSALAEEQVWELTAGLSRRDRALALRALHRLLGDANEPHYLLAMVAMQLRKVLQATQLVERRASDGDIARALRMRPAEVDAVRRAASGAVGAADALERLTAANRDMNLHRAGPERVLEALVLDICTPA